MSHPPKYSCDSIKVLQKVWVAASGKYLAGSISLLLDLLERSGELMDGSGRYSAAVRIELKAMSPARINRYLAPVKAKDQLKGKPSIGLGRCCAPRSRSARLAATSRHARGSSSSTPSRTARGTPPALWT